MSVITRGLTPKLMRPGLNQIFGEAYEQLPDQWSALYEHNTSTMNYEEDQQIITMGLAHVKGEGASISYDDIKQGYPSRYVHTVYGLGFIITKEQVDDNLYLQIADIKTKGLAYSMAITKNYNGANIFNYAYDNGHPGGDGVPLISNSHPTESGLMSNTLDVSADLSESSLENLLIQLQDARDARNKKMALRETSLLIPLQLQFEAERIIKNPQRPNTADRDINAMFSMGRFPGGIIVNNFLNDPNAWFILTNCPNGLRYFERSPIEFMEGNDYDTRNMKFSATERYSFSWSDWHGSYGSGSA
jgi:hypothetical protein